MRRIVIIAIAVVTFLTATSVSAQRLPNRPAPPSAGAAPAGDPAIAAARRITREEAIKMVREGKGVYVDVRSKQSFDRGHIKGALSFPNSQLISRARELPPGKTIITYCACVKEHSAAVAVANLNSAGFKNAGALVGGWDEWIALGLPIEKTKK